MKKYNWATLGCGVIANELAQAMEIRGQKLYSVANRTYKKAVEFADKYGIEKVYNNIDEVFEDENVDIIFPHLTIHIFRICEKLWQQENMYCVKSQLH